jgi:hypothetical protein
MKFKGVKLFLVSSLVCILFFQLPWYKSWFAAKMICDNCSIASQSEYMGVEDRMAARFGVSYNIFKAIASKIRNSSFKNAVILIPPNDYVVAMKPADNLLVPEPAVFYYFTGIKTVSVTSPGVGQANLVFLIKGNKPWIDYIRNRQECDSFVNAFKKYIK